MYIIINFYQKQLINLEALKTKHQILTLFEDLTLFINLKIMYTFLPIINIYLIF